MFLDPWGLHVVISEVNNIIVFHVDCLCLCVSGLALYSMSLNIGTLKQMGVELLYSEIGTNTKGKHVGIKVNYSSAGYNTLSAICESSGRSRPTRCDVHLNMSTSVFGSVGLI